MRIDGDESTKLCGHSQIDAIHQIQEQQERSEAENGVERELRQAEQLATTQPAGEAQAMREDDEQSAIEAGQASLAPENRQDVQGDVGAQQTPGAESRLRVDGTSRAAEAVDSAHRQQDRGETWERFARVDGTEVPPSVEETSHAVRQQGEQRDAEQQAIRARELQNDLMIRRGMIKS